MTGYEEKLINYFQSKLRAREKVIERLQTQSQKLEDINKKLNKLIEMHKPKEDKGKLDLPNIMKDKGCSTCRFNDTCTDTAKEVCNYGIDCKSYEKWSNV